MSLESGSSLRPARARAQPGANRGTRLDAVRVCAGRARALLPGVLGLPAAPVRIVGESMSSFVYRYELRRGQDLVATGHLPREQAVEDGDRIVISGLAGIVRAVEPILGERELRLVVQLWREAE